LQPVQPTPSVCSSTKPSVTKPKAKRLSRKKAIVKRYQDDISDQDSVDDINDQDHKGSNQGWTVPNHRWQTRSKVAPKATSMSSAARIRPWFKHKTTARVKQVRLQASRKQQAEELARKRHAEEKEAQKQLARAKRALAREKMIKEQKNRERSGQMKLCDSNCVKERSWQKKLKTAQEAVAMTQECNEEQPCSPLGLPYPLATSASTLSTTQQQPAERLV